jgi:hypothetical protein
LLLAGNAARLQRKRARLNRPYRHPTLGKDGMIYWLALAAQEARLKQGRKQVHIAASIDRDQSTVNRFEQGEHWPRDPDELVKGYADDLDMDPTSLWAEALRLWRESLNGNS